MTIEETIQEILTEQHEMRWMDTSDLEIHLRQVADAQKAIDEEELGKALLYCSNKTTERVKREMIDKAKKVFCDTCMGQCKDKSHCDTLQKFTYAMEE